MNRSCKRGALAAGAIALFAVALAGLADAQTSAVAAEGDWVGELRIPQGVRLAVHIHRAEDGGLIGAVDSPDQSVTGMPLDVHRDGDHMILSTPANGGQRLELIWDAASAGWTGQYFGGAGQFPIGLTRGALKPWPKVDGLDGDWQATASYDATTLRLALHIASTSETTAGALTSPEQAGLEIPLGFILRSGAHVAFDVPALRGTFSGDLSADGKTLKGVYSQSNLDAPVAFARKEAAPLPQNKP